MFLANSWTGLLSGQVTSQYRQVIFLVGSGSGIAHPDPDPAKSYRSGRIRFCNTAELPGYRYLFWLIIHKLSVINVFLIRRLGLGMTDTEYRYRYFTITVLKYTGTHLSTHCTCQVSFEFNTSIDTLLLQIFIGTRVPVFLIITGTGSAVCRYPIWSTYLNGGSAQWKSASWHWNFEPIGSWSTLYSTSFNELPVL